jgi:peptidoglycan/xylan/chitin deacetylase (PgdA/CDA1 family)
MRERAYLGRVGAGLLVALAGGAVIQALAGSEPEAASGDRLGPPVTVRAAPPGPVTRTSSPPVQEAVEPVRVVPAGRSVVRVPILMYHYVRVNPDPRDRLGYDLSVTPADFQQQMDWLAANGYHPVDFGDLRGYLLGHGTLPARPVVITFDDGYRDLYTEAYPVLRAHSFKAVAYIVSGFLDSPANVTREQVEEMDVHGIQIGSHTVSHADLTKLPAGDVRRQLEDSKAALEALLGHPVVDFCYPGGANNQAVQQAVQAAGYQSATTTAPGTSHSAADRYAWSRVRVSGGEPLSQFASQLGPEEQTAVEVRPREASTFIPTLPPQPAAALGLEASSTALPTAAVYRGVTP